MVGNRIVGQLLNIDFVSAGVFMLSGRFPGRYSYSSNGPDSATITLLFDAGGRGTLSGRSLNLQFSFGSATRGGLTLSGSRFDWFLSGISEPGRQAAPLFLDRRGSRLVFFIFDVFERQETRVYDLQIREKTSPPASWQTGCVDGVGRPTPFEVNFRSFSFNATLPRASGTYQARHCHGNSSRCRSGTPGEWSEIGEGGVTSWPW